jgi:hypothetical protein
MHCRPSPTQRGTAAAYKTVEWGRARLDPWAMMATPDDRGFLSVNCVRSIVVNGHKTSFSPEMNSGVR